MKVSLILLILDSSNCNVIILHHEVQDVYHPLPKKGFIKKHTKISKFKYY